MIELFGKSLVRSWAEQASKWTPDARRKFGAGAIVYGLGVMLQLSQNLARSPLFAHSRDLVGALMVLGLALQTWGMVARYHNSGRLNDQLGTANAKR